MFTIETCERLPDEEALTGLLTQYYALAVRRMREIGFEIDPAGPQSALAEFWACSDDYLPPLGCLAVARDGSGRLVGCAMMKRLDPETGEFKRDFVTEAARGKGAGRGLMEAREAAARRMGLTRLVADTLPSNVEMQSLYPKMGFREVEGPIETTSYLDQPMLRPYLRYFVKAL